MTLHHSVRFSCVQEAEFHYRLNRAALINSARDALDAARLLPHFVQPLILSAEVLIRLLLFQEAAQCYEEAAKVNEVQARRLSPLIMDLRTAATALEDLRRRSIPDRQSVPLVLEKIASPLQVF